MARPCFSVTRPAIDHTMALVVGGAQCVWDDLSALEALVGGPWSGIIVAANNIAIHLPHLDHWVTRHPEKLRRDSQHEYDWGWERQRAECGHPRDYVTHGPKRNIVDRHADTPGGPNGSTGFLAAVVALRETEEYTTDPRVVLAGIPMTASPHFDESVVHTTGKNWASASAHFRGWTSTRGRMQLGHHVRSMSGNTMKLLGRPTLDWLLPHRLAGEEATHG